MMRSALRLFWLTGMSIAAAMTAGTATCRLQPESFRAQAETSREHVAAAAAASTGAGEATPAPPHRVIATSAATAPAESAPASRDPATPHTAMPAAGPSIAATSAPLAPDAITAGAVSPDSAGPITHLTVGRSLFVNTQARLRRVYVNNPAVLDSYTASPNRIVITGKATGVGTVVLSDENGESQAYPVSVDVDVAALRKALKQALPAEQIEVEGVEGRISLAGTVPTAADADTALKLAQVYTKDVANALRILSPRSRQIRLQVRIIEVDRTKLEQLGFNFFGVGTNTFNSTTQQYPSIAANANTSSTSATSSSNALTQSLLGLTDPLNFLLFNSNAGVGAAIKDLANRQLAQILAEPTITAMDGEKASFLSGGEFPFPVVQGGTGGFTSVTIQFRPYGVKLEFTPTVTPQGTIKLKVAPEVSALDFTNAVTISGYTIPALATRRAETGVELRSGQTFAISGLLDHRTTDLFQHTPGISSVPILGELFKSKSINHSTVELMVLVTPELVDPLTETTPPAPPKLPVPLLDPGNFDARSPGKHSAVTPGVQP
jgi:pilus assembly protein CpaC